MSSTTLFGLVLAGLSTAFYTVAVRDGIKAILGRIATFVLSALLLYSVYGYHYIALLFVIIYIGAIAILFVFVVMMVPVQHSTARYNKFPMLVAATVALTAFIGGLQYLYGYNGWMAWTGGAKSDFPSLYRLVMRADHYAAQTPDIMRMAWDMMLHNYFAFLLAALILLVVLMGAITLTANRRQD